VLTDDGKNEADKIGNRLSKKQIPMTYLSPLPRTLQTADRILTKQPVSSIYYSKDNTPNLTGDRVQKGDTTGGQQYGVLQPEQSQYFSLEDYGHDYSKMRAAYLDKKNQLTEQGAKITRDNGVQLKWIPQQNINYELQSEGGSGLSREGKSGTPPTRFNNIGRGEEAIQRTGNTLTANQKRSKAEVSDRTIEHRVLYFLGRIGASAKWVPDTGQSYREVIDTLRGAIELVEGRADAKTLGHATIHQFVALLPKEGNLYKAIIKRGETNPNYDDVYQQYKDDPHYQNADGTVNEEKMAEESFVHMADDVLHDVIKDRATKGLWDRFMQWLKDMVGRIKEALGGKSLTVENLDNPEETVAEEIAGGHTGRLSREKMKLMREAAEKGEIYYELDPADKKRVEVIRDKATDAQKAIIDAIYLKPDTSASQATIDKLGIKPHERVTLDEATHIYSDLHGTIYDSVTTKINGKFTPEQQELYKLNREWGIQFDNILQGVILGKNIDDVPSELPDSIKQDAYATMRSFIQQHTSDGSIALTQVIVADPQSGTAGSIDLLLLSPEGFATVVDLKTSIRPTIEKGRLSSTYTRKFPVKEGSVFAGTDIALSKELQHAIQVGSYSKMLELQGIPVIGAHSLHLQMKVVNGQVSNYKNEGLISHPVDDNQPYIDAIVPTPIDTDHPSQLQMDRPGYDYSDMDMRNPLLNDTRTEQEKVEDAEELNKMEALQPVVEGAIDLLKQRTAWVQDLNNTKPGADIKGATIDTITQLRRSLMRKADTKEYGQALNQFMEYTRKQVGTTAEFINNTDNITNGNGDDYPRILIQATKFLEGYWGVYRLVGSPVSSKFPEYSKTVGMLNDLRQSISDGQRAYFMHYFQQQNKDIGTFPDDMLKEWVYGKSKDITQGTYLADAPHGTRDIGVSMMDKALRDAIFDANALGQDKLHRLEQIHQNLYTALGQKSYQKGQFKFMTNPDGSYVQRIGKPYWDKVKIAYNQTIDENGNKIQYMEGNSPEAIAHNKELYRKNQEYSHLTKAEVYNYDKRDYDEGAHQRYNEEFELARQQHETRNAQGRWIPRNEDSSAYKAYREKYYILIPDVYDTAGSFDKTGEFTGIVGDKTNLWIVNPRYKEVKDYADVWDPQAKKMVKEDQRDSRYVSMMDNKSAIGRAQSQFYSEFMALIDEYHGQLPLHIYDALKGKMPVKQATVIQQCIKTGLGGVLGVLGKATKDEFAYGTYYGERMVDEAGNFKQSIPLSYTGSYRNQAAIDKLMQQITALESRKQAGEFKGKAAIKEYREQRELLKAQLDTEQRKITPDQVEENIVKSLSEFIPQAEKFVQMDMIEDKVLGIQALIEDKARSGGYIQRDASGRVINKKGTTEPLSKQEGDVYAVKMAHNLVDTVLYNAGERDNSFMNMVAEKMLKYTGIKVFAINPLTSSSVWAMGTFNLFRSAVGSQHFTMKTFARALGEYYSKMMPAYAKGKAASIAGGKLPKYQSKGEAFVARYQVPVKMFAGDKGAFHYLTIAEHATEYFIQSVPALATAMTNDITGADGTTKKLDDCWDYDPVTGDINPVAGFEHVASDPELHKWFEYFQDVNNMEHGPFAAMEQNTMNRNWVGKLLNMFHRILWPGFKSRFASSYTHQSFGEMEGSYVTAVNFIKDMKHYEGTIREKVETGWADLSHNEQANIRKTLVDIMLFTVGFALISVVKSLAAGVPEEDKNLRRWMNFLQKTSERVVDSQLMYIPIVGSYQAYQLVKSPVAALGTMADFCDAMQETMRLPLPPYTDHYYTNGIHKGELKASVKLQKALPGVSVLQQWDNMTSGHYFHQ
jgi:hypothetical protein